MPQILTPIVLLCVWLCLVCEYISEILCSVIINAVPKISTDTYIIVCEQLFLYIAMHNHLAHYQTGLLHM